MQRQKPIAVAGEMCRYFQKDVSKVCHKCHHFVKLQGTNKNTGEQVDEWMCADVAQVILQAENAQMSREAGAAVESMRNEMVKLQGMANLIEAEKLKLSQLYLVNKGNKDGQ